MTCFSAKRKISAFVDGQLRPLERSKVAAHLEDCRDCSAHLYELTSVVTGLRQLQTPRLPPLLSTRLRVIASRERSTLLQPRGSRLAAAWDRWRLQVDDLMRALTIPATGGLLSSVILFACLAFSISQTAASVGYEVPVFMEDRSGANQIPVDVRSDVVLTISLDGEGHIQDYSVRDGARSYTSDPALLISNSISMPRFPTVLSMTHPITGDIRISLTPIVFRQ